MTSIRLLALPAQSDGSLWLPEQASTVAESVDSAWWLVYWISVAFFVIVVATQAYFMYAYRRRAGWTEQQTAHHNYPLELTWSILPAIIIVVMFVRGFTGFLDMRTPPANTYDITVVAKKWNWSFIYPNGIVHPELHVPLGKDVKLIMSSDDVIHSLFIPAFRVKQDIVPGRYNYLWFNATKVGEYDLECTEYCGTNHSEMLAKVIVHDGDGMNDWLKEQEDIILSMPPLELGELLYTQRGCSQCHSLDGTKRIGPSFTETYGNAHEFSNAPTMSAADANENYIRESILNPQALVRAGYPPSMPTYKGLLQEKEIRGLVTFIKAQNPEFKAEAERESAAATAENEEGEADGEDAATNPAPNPEASNIAPGDQGGEPAQGR